MNQRTLYRAFMQCQNIYGQTEIHVQLIARQTGLTAAEVVQYCLDNPTLVTTRMRAANDVISNPVMGQEYAGMYIRSVSAIPFLTTESVINQGANGGTIVVILEGATFETAAETEANWTVDVGNTGLTFTTAVKDSDTQCTLTFTGTARLGNITIMAENAAISASSDSDILTFAVSAATLDYATIIDLTSRISSLEGLMPSQGEFTAAVAETGSIELDTGISLDFTNKTKGDIGLEVNLIDPEEETADEVIEVVGNVINVTLAWATDAITSTAAQVKSAIEGNTAANALVSVAITGATSTLAIAGTVTLSNGVDGTVMAQNKMLIGASKLAVAKTATTASDSSGCELITYDA